MVRQLDSQLDG